MSDFSDAVTMDAYDVFISYSSKNKLIADALCHYLEDYRIRCWIAPRDILPGQEYAEAIDNAMKQVKIFLIVCSKDSFQSQWVHKETNLAVSDGKIILPFRIDNCSLEESGMRLYLNDRHWIDAVPDPQKVFTQVVEAVRALLRKPENRVSPHPVPPYEAPAPSGSNSQSESDAWSFQYSLKCFTKNLFGKYCRFKGRTTRHEFWFYTLYLFLSFVLLGIIADSANSDALFGLLGLAVLAAILPSVAIQVRRLHDANFSGWLVLLCLIPYVGALINLVLYCMPSTKGANKFDSPSHP